MAALVDADLARKFVDEAEFHWHQRFHLAPEVPTAGSHDVEWLAQVVELPEDLSGLSVLDVGTTNGGAAFICEARGASVTATDIVPDTHFGFAHIRELLGSRARFVQSSIYELPERLRGEKFDLVIFWGVLYHLRHPLLGLDSVRRLTRGEVSIETAVSDHAMPQVSDLPAVQCNDDPVGNGDVTNWFIPNTTALTEWVSDAGFEPLSTQSWPASPSRAHVRARVGTDPPPYVSHGNAFERPFAVSRIDEGLPRRSLWERVRRAGRAFAGR